MKKGWTKCKSCDGFGQLPDSATAYDVQDTTCSICLGDGKLPPIDEVQQMGKIDKKKLKSLWDKIKDSEVPMPTKIFTFSPSLTTRSDYAFPKDFEGVLHAQKIGVVDKKPQKVGKKNPYTIAAAQILRSIPSKKRIETSRKNGKKGGRPKSNFVVKG